MRGIRFSLGDPATAVVKADMIEPLAKRIANLGWHVQFNVEGKQIVELADLLRRLPTPLVFDHLAHPPLPAGIDSTLPPCSITSRASPDTVLIGSMRMDSRG